MEIIKSKYSKKESEKFVDDLQTYICSVSSESLGKSFRVRMEYPLPWNENLSFYSEGLVVKRPFNFLNSLSNSFSDMLNCSKLEIKSDKYFAGITLQRKSDPYLAYIPFLKQHGLSVNSVDETFLHKFDENLPGSSIESFLKKYDIKTKYLLSDNTREWR